MSTQEEMGEQLQTKTFFCHSCQNEFRKNPNQVMSFSDSLPIISNWKPRRAAKQNEAVLMEVITFQEFVCPQCLDGFIEELPESSSSNQSSEEPEDSQILRGVFNEFSMGPFQLASGNNNTPYFRIANEILAPILNGGFGSNGR